ncbi:TPA: hypothetical protein ACNPUC_001421 [Raoultella planticola]
MGEPPPTVSRQVLMLLADWTEGDGQREIIIDSDFHPVFSNRQR